MSLWHLADGALVGAMLVLVAIVIGLLGLGYLLALLLNRW